MTTTVTTRLVEAALGYARRGWAVLPLKPRDKTPLFSLVPNAVGDATTDADTIERWWTAHPDANIGIALGRRSGIVVADVDNRNTAWEELATYGGAIPTPTVVTSKGWHLYFAYPDFDVPNLVEEQSQSADLGLRSDGYYVMAPPSVHPATGQPHEWDAANGLDLDSVDPIPIALAVVEKWVEATGQKNGKKSTEVPEYVQRLLNRLDKVTGRGPKWKARCPAHDDEHPSLSVRWLDGNDEDGKILLHCHAGCRTEEIRRTLGIEWSDLSPPNTRTDERDGSDTSFRFKWLNDIEIESLPPVEDLVERHIPESSHVVLFGQPGTGKTFLALDLALSVGTGTAWHNLTVNQGPVCYIAAEGSAGLPSRVKAWKEVHLWEGAANVQFLPQPIQFLKPVDVANLLHDIQTFDPNPKLVVIDTLAWCFAGGDENSARDVGIFNEAANQLRRTTGATILTCHHTGRDGIHERGSTALAGAADTMMKLKTADETVVLQCTKQKESPLFPNMRFKLLQAGESCVLSLSGGEAPTGELKPSAMALLRVLKDTECGMSCTAWQNSSRQAPTTFYRNRKELDDGGYIELRHERYCFTEKGHEAVTTMAVPR